MHIKKEKKRGFWPGAFLTLGHEPKVGFEEGLRRTVAWFAGE